MNPSADSSQNPIRPRTINAIIQDLLQWRNEEQEPLEKALEKFCFDATRDAKNWEIIVKRIEEKEGRKSFRPDETKETPGRIRNAADAFNILLAKWRKSTDQIVDLKDEEKIVVADALQFALLPAVREKAAESRAELETFTGFFTPMIETAIEKIEGSEINIEQEDSRKSFLAYQAKVDQALKAWKDASKITKELCERSNYLLPKQVLGEVDNFDGIRK